MAAEKSHPPGSGGHSLTGIQLLAGLPLEELSSLEGRAAWRRFAAGEEVLSRDSTSRDVMFVAQGSVRIVNFSATGREVAYAVVAAGGCFGEMAAVDGEPRTASVLALEPCLIAVVPPDAFRSLLERHAPIAIRVIEKLARIIRDCDERIMDLATLGAYQRVYREIIKRAKPDPLRAGSWLVYPLPTQVEIASHASTTRETVARVLSSLAQAEIVGRKGKTLYIRDRARLERLVERADPGA